MELKNQIKKIIGLLLFIPQFGLIRCEAEHKGCLHDISSCIWPHFEAANTNLAQFEAVSIILPIFFTHHFEEPKRF